MAVVILKDSFISVKISENKMSFGLFGGNSLVFSDVQKIKASTDVEIIDNGTTKILKVVNIEKNEQFYLEIIKEIAEKTNLKIIPEDIVEKIKTNTDNKYKAKGHPLRLNSWIFILFIMVIISFVTYLLGGLSTILLALINSDFLSVVCSAVFAQFIILKKSASFRLQKKLLQYKGDFLLL